MTQPTSPLRQRMIDDMTMRNLSANTQETYIRSVAQFSAFHRRSPDKLGVKHVRDFHLHLVSRGLVAHSIAVKMAALRFFYGTTLRRPDIAAEIPTPRRPDRLPTVLARAEVERLLKAVGDLKLRTALMTLFGRFAHLRGDAAHATGYRQRAHGDLRAAGQRVQGSLYGPVRPAARHSSPLLASDTAIALAVSRPQSGPADDQAGVATGLPARGRGRRAEQVGHGPHVATQFCDPPA
jgi:Phage integrase, N-terminal SAM-like domain